MNQCIVSPADIQGAIENDELAFHYQPMVSFVTGRLVGAEALLRWRRRDGTLCAPEQFIQVAEQSGLISSITLHMFPKLLADWLVVEGIKPDFCFCLNVSARDFETEGLVEAIRLAVRNRELDPSRFGIELTESSLLQGSDRVQQGILEVVKAGVALIMDDYETGFSSIDTLSQWPFDCIKIDRQIISRMGESRKSSRIVNASIRMAHELGLSVVAEGVESQASYEFLLQAGCTKVQGYWIAPALPLAELLQFIRHDQQWLAMPIGLLYLAQLDHIQWRRSIISAVTAMAFGEGPEVNRNFVELPELDPTKCGLGQWYYGEGKRFSSNAAFRKLETVHRRLHDVGKHLTEVAEAGGSREHITDIMRELTARSIEVIGLLQELENGAVLTTLGPRGRHRAC
jgi:EAL domain-containing protein (putative c-di-GMP-specific phosphodiesterase class I)